MSEILDSTLFFTTGALIFIENTSPLTKVTTTLRLYMPLEIVYPNTTILIILKISSGSFMSVSLYPHVDKVSIFLANSSSLVLLSSGFIAGKNKTSLMLFESVRNIVIRSIPMPHPPVGGKPYSSAVQYPSSINIASSSPDFLSATCCSNLDLCTMGSFNSVYALQISFLQQNSSNRSVSPDSERCHLAT